jgi:hypothetical protein
MKTTTYFQGYGSGSPPSPGATRQSGSGGGARVTERSAPKVEPRPYAMSPAAASQLGGHIGTHVMDGGGKEVRGGAQSLVTGPGLMCHGPTVTQPGPGGGRTLYGQSGTQQQHGEVAGRPFQASHRGWEPNPAVRKVYGAAP